jgi:hypothetical protein
MGEESGGLTASVGLQFGKLMGNFHFCVFSTFSFV